MIVSENHSAMRCDILIAVGVGAVTFDGGLTLAAGSMHRKATPLPTGTIIRCDYQRMVDFGPRLPGSPDHIRPIEYSAHKSRQIGLTLGRCDSYAYKRWDSLDYGLGIKRNGSSWHCRSPTMCARSQLQRKG